MSKHKNKEKKNKEKKPADEVYQPDDKPIARARRWPEVSDLIAWWVFYNLDGVPSADVTPELIKEWMLKGAGKREMKLPQIHEELYGELKEFQDEFLPVDFSPPYAD
jgi:hypothetical protein